MSEVATTDYVMPEGDARRLTERIRSTLDTTARGLDRLAAYVSEAYSNRADLALGYGSWREYAEAEFGEQTRDLAAPIRRELVSYLSADGMSTRAIAPAVGVSQQAVSKAQRHPEVTTKLSPVSASSADSPSEPEIDLANVDMATGEILDAPVLTDEPDRVTKLTGANSVSHPGPVTGLDGKTYKRPEPREQKPRRRPITDAARDAGWELRKAVERLERIAADDRFDRNKEEVATLLRGHLNNAIETCQGLVDHLDQSQED